MVYGMEYWPGYIGRVLYRLYGENWHGYMERVLARVYRESTGYGIWYGVLPEYIVKIRYRLYEERTG